MSEHEATALSSPPPRAIGLPIPHLYDVPPQAQYKGHNPALRGIVMLAAARLVRSSDILGRFFCHNAGFHELDAIKLLGDIEPRYRPTVVPVVPAGHGANVDLSLKEPPERLLSPTVNGFPSAADYHNAYKSGKLTPTAVVDALLPLIRRDLAKPTAHATAFCEVHVEELRSAAAESTKRYAEGKNLGILDGVPVAIKDQVDILGYKTTYGTPSDWYKPPPVGEPASSWCVERLFHETGALLLGKTNMHELGSDTTNCNVTQGTPLNPYNSSHYTGGSSGGSAYALGAGLCPLALGGDGGGSIRLPSSYCGVYGLKTTHDRVSMYPLPNLAASVGVVGPMGATMSDIEIGYRLMAVPDPQQPEGSGMFPAPGLPRSRRTKTLGVFREWIDYSEPAVREACNKTIDWLVAEKGYTVVDISIPFLNEGQLAHGLAITAELLSVELDYSKLDAPNQMVFSVVRHAKAVTILNGYKLRHVLMQHLAALFAKHEGLLIITPTSPFAGRVIHSMSDLKWGFSDPDLTLRSMQYVWLANFTGLPALSCPVGYAKPGKGKGPLPIGVMLAAEWGYEEEVIDAGYDVEQYLNTGLEGGRVMPSNFVDVLGRNGQEKVAADVVGEAGATKEV